MTGIWQPASTAYRVVIETDANVKPFGLFANLITYVKGTEANAEIPQPSQFLINEKELTWATKTLASQMGFDSNPQAKDYWPSSINELSPECQSMVNSGPAKAYASGIFGAMAAGVVGKIVGTAGGLLNVSVEGLKNAGEVAAWISSSVFDGLTVIDTAKFHLAYYASNAFAWNIRKITAVKLPEREFYCVGKPMFVDSVWYNQCGQPLWGVGSQFNSMYGMSPADLAQVDLLGPVQVTAIPAGVATILSGMGARYRITGLKPGRLSMVFKASGTELYENLEIVFKKCTSKELEQY